MIEQLGMSRRVWGRCRGSARGRMVVPANVGRRSSASSKIAARAYRLSASEGARVDATRIHPSKPVDGFSLTDVTGDFRKGTLSSSSAASPVAVT